MNTTKHARADQATVTMTHPEDDMLTLTVEDDGIGYDAEQALSADNSQSGFGLFSLRERLRMIGGELDIDSAPGRGARISLSCPQNPRESDSEQPAEKPGPSASPSGSPQSTGESHPTRRPGQTIRIMLADDHRMIRDVLAGMLGDEEDFEVVAGAATGREAIEQLDQAAPDVVVMDVSMPLMDGIEATQWIASNRPNIRVIGLSMHEREDMANAMLQAGAVTYLTKGGPPDDLVQAIREAFAADRTDSQD